MSAFEELLSWAGIDSTPGLGEDPFFSGLESITKGFDKTTESNDWLSGVGASVKDMKLNEVPTATEAGGTDFFKQAWDFIKNKENAHITTLGAAFIKGAFSYGDEKKKARALQTSSEANMLNATSQDEKWRAQMANASSIGQTNFGSGIMSPGFKDLAAVRRARSGGVM